MLTESCPLRRSWVRIRGRRRFVSRLRRGRGGRGQGIAEALLVAAQDDANLGLVEGSGCCMARSAGEQDNQAAFHICYAGAGCDLCIGARNDGVFLERAGGLKDRVHVADEQEALTAFTRSLMARMFRYQVASTSRYGLHWNPAGFESESLEVRGRRMFLIASTPAKFMVPLLTFTICSRRARSAVVRGRRWSGPFGRRLRIAVARAGFERRLGLRQPVADRGRRRRRGIGVNSRASREGWRIPRLTIETLRRGQGTFGRAEFLIT